MRRLSKKDLDPEEVEKIAAKNKSRSSQCCGKLVMNAPVLYVDDVLNAHPAGTLGYCVKCMKPAKRGDDQVYRIFKAEAFPEDFNQAVFEVVKAIGWHYSRRFGGGFFLARADGRLGVINTDGRVHLPKVLAPKELAAANAHQPEEPEPQEFE